MPEQAIDLNKIVARLDSVERENRKLKQAAIVTAALVVVCLVSMGQSEAGKTVEAQRFVLKSAKGNVQAELYMLEGDYPKLSLISPNGEKVTELSPLGISVSDYPLGLDSHKLPLAHLGNTGLYFTNAEGKTVLELGGASTSNLQLAPIPEIKIFDHDGKVVWHAPQDGH